MIEQVDILGGRPCMFVHAGERHTLVPLTFGIDAAHAAVPRLLAIRSDDEIARRCLPRGEGPGCYWWGWGRA